MDAVICEKDQATAEALRVRLVREGFEVSGLFTGATDCLARCRHLRPDVAALSAATAHGPHGSQMIDALESLGVAVMIVDPDDPDPSVGDRRDDKPAERLAIVPSRPRSE